MRDFKEGVHYYMEDGVLVLTEKFHLERGHCCHNGCRHCPYGSDNGKNTTGKVFEKGQQN